MKQSIVIIGMGEMAGVFARGFLKAGYSVTPVDRQDDIQAIAKEIPAPLLALVAVGEKDLAAVLEQIPLAWQDRLVLLQNELLPDDWTSKGINNPTVISVWFEKKPGMDYKVLVPSPVHGPKAAIIERSLRQLKIPVQIIENEADMLFELVRKNMYILTTNICGLETGGNVSELWKNNAIIMNKVFDDVLDIQQHLTGKAFDRDHLLNSVLTAFEGDPEHQCMGRSAPDRLQRALGIANIAGLESPTLKSLTHCQKD